MKNVLTCCLLFTLLGSAAPNGASAQGVDLGDGIRLELDGPWSEAESAFDNAVELTRPPDPAVLADEPSQVTPRLVATTEPRTSHDDALRRLREIAAEWPGRPTFLEIDGWPALQRRQERTLTRTAEDKYWVADDQLPTVVHVTTAVAYGDTVVRLEGVADAQGGETLAAEIERLCRGLELDEPADPGRTRRALSRLRSRRGVDAPRPRAAADAPVGDDAAAAIARLSVVEVGAPVGVHGGVGELEIATSNDGQVVVLGANSGRSNSTDGGDTFTFRGGTPGPACCFDGDPSLAMGASGAFYYAYIAFPDGTAAWNGALGCSTGVNASTDNGVNFPFRGNAGLCPLTGAVCFPDQEHIAADRFNAAPGGGDQVYSVWRDFVPAGGTPNCNQIGSGFVTPSIVCSQDGGVNWTAKIAVGVGDFPRVTVGQDGFVYVVYASGGNIMINKYSSCSAGLTQQAGFPVVVGPVSNVVCPVPGLDRCNDGNMLSSPTVAVDDTNPNHVYVAYATNTAAGNENVVVRDSLDGGLTWPNAVTVNTATNARRFMPWVCTTEGNAYVAWYDRRAATAAANDLTGFFLGSAASVGGALVAGPEIDVSGVADPQCASPWCRPRSTNDAESCSVQPQLAGTCSVSGAPCDFSDGCPPGAGACQNGGGCPKYGDYNGIACANGWVFAGWSSATPPAGVTAPSGGISVYHSRVRVGAAPVADAGGPYTTDEGTPVSLDGSGSEDAGPGALTFDWDFDADGVFDDASGATPSFGGVQQSGVFPVSLRVTDVDGNTDVDATIVTVLNVPPSVNAGADQLGFEDETLTVTATYTDPGVLDTHTALIDWGDGTPATAGVVTPGAPGSGTVTGDHVYPDPGVFTVTVTVTDSDGGSGSDTLTATVVHAFLQYCLFGLGTDPREDRVDVHRGVTGDCRAGANAPVKYRRDVVLTGGVRSYRQKVSVGGKDRLTGDVEAGGGVKVQRRAEVTGDVTAAGDLVLRSRSTVDGDATAGGAVRAAASATVTGTTTPGAAVPPSPPVTPVTLTLTSGGAGVTVARNQTRVLAPGSFGSLETGRGAVLELSTGRYRFDDFELGRGSTLRLDVAAGPVIVDVTGELRLGRETRMELVPAAGDAADVFFQKQGPGRVRLGKEGRYLGTFLAPEAEVVLGRGAALEGALYGRESDLKRGAQVTQRPAVDVFVSLFLP